MRVSISLLNCIFLVFIFSTDGRATEDKEERYSSVELIWASIQQGDLESFETKCKLNEHPICIMGRFVLGQSDARTFLINSRFTTPRIVLTISEDQALGSKYYQKHLPNPMGAGYVFSILNLVSSLSNLYPIESFDTLMVWYEASEGEYAEFSKEKLRIFLNSNIAERYKSELIKKYGNKLQEVQDD